jgi:hypothetical protein
MDMRHETGLLGEGAQEIGVGFDAIERGQAQALKPGKLLQDLAQEQAESG